MCLTITAAEAQNRSNCPLPRTASGTSPGAQVGVRAPEEIPLRLGQEGRSRDIDARAPRLERRHNGCPHAQLAQRRSVTTECRRASVP